MKTSVLMLLLILPSQLSAGVVALTILAEARGEAQDGMAAVACVIAQRAINRNLTPEQVCLQKIDERFRPELGQAERYVLLDLLDPVDL